MPNTQRSDSSRPDSSRPTEPTKPGGRTLLVLLGAGAGARFDGPTHKLNAPFGTSTVASTAIRNAIAANAGDVAVVVGATALDNVPDSVTIIVNPEWHLGQATSIQAAARYAHDNDYDSMVIALADQPMLSGAAWRAVASARSAVAYATYHGARGHPIRFARSVWNLFPTDGDHGARAVLDTLAEHAEPIVCSGSPSDIDTVEDLIRWQNN